MGILSVRFTIPWKPRAKQRPRVKNNRAYTPKETRLSEEAIAAAFREAIEGTDFERFDGPIDVYIGLADTEFTLEIEPTVDHTNRKLRGDIDNYAKTILDALNTIAWVDDVQIRVLRMEKL